MNHLSLSLPAELRCSVTLPSSKSISARALILNALCGQPFELRGLSDCDDTQAVIAALSDNPEVIDIGAAGTAMRFLTAYYATREGETHILTGTKRMKQRPIGILVNALRELGAEIYYEEQEGYPPLRIVGKQLHGGTVNIAGNVSSQFISALMLIGVTMPEEIALNIMGHLASRPYVEMTQALLAHFAQAMQSTSPTMPAALIYEIEPDWSAASYWYALVALSPDPEARVVLRGLKAQSVQGDSCCAQRFESLGVATSFTPEGAVLTKSGASPEKFLNWSFADCPDLAQTFVVVCALLGVGFHFSGLESLKIKETNRILALQMELHKFGLTLIEPREGSLSFDATRQLRQKPLDTEIFIDTYDDHRMAMSFAPAALRYPHLHIRYPEVVSKSYPHFWDDLGRMNQG